LDAALYVLAVRYIDIAASSPNFGLLRTGMPR
jgi:hypothetical protein